MDKESVENRKRCFVLGAAPLRLVRLDCECSVDSLV
jgi:hypothetical protein